MVDLNEIIDNIITQIEIDNSIIMISKKNSLGSTVININIDYLRHHPLLKDARVFRLIMGFTHGLWKKPEYTQSKYKSIFTNFNITYKKWILFREFLNFGEIKAINDFEFKQKLEVLYGISTTFGGIPYIDDYYDNSYYHKKINKMYKHIVSRPEEDYDDKYQWGVYNSQQPGYLSWLYNYKPVNGWTHLKSREGNDIVYYARRPLKN